VRVFTREPRVTLEIKRGYQVVPFQVQGPLGLFSEFTTGAVSPVVTVIFPAAPSSKGHLLGLGVTKDDIFGTVLENNVPLVAHILGHFYLLVHYMIIRVLKIGPRYYTVGNSVVGFVNEPSARSCKNFLERRGSGRITVSHERLSGLQRRCRDWGVGILGVHYFDYTGILQAEELHDELGLVPTNPRLLLEREYNRAWWAGDHLE